ncbi:glycosyltransferase family 1 protein [Microlunatus elymi]|uniref:Glycosyltransferase family 1 protein n=1 Tax=Microlunatus elymi TaxID=2596828 RepID=A0A516PW54_9ACTN|nr:glycosyltransferase [Microlunatus elymi]QDP95414.1 glycosyltransferase family 1 protein [Microlunatus elymi]
MLPLARALVQDGHRVVWYAGRRFCPDIASVGAEFIPTTRADDVIANRSMKRRRRSTNGPRAIRESFATFFLGQAETQLDDLLEITGRQRVDAVLCDLLMFAPQLLHAVGGPPWATLGDGPLEFDDELAPPFGPGYLPDQSLWGRQRDFVVRRTARRLVYGPLQLQWQEIQARNGIRTKLAAVQERISPYLHLQACPPGFEYPRHRLPPQLHWIGVMRPVPSQGWTEPTWLPTLADAGRPVILITQGTMRPDPNELIIPAIKALADHPVQLLVLTGQPNSHAVDRALRNLGSTRAAITVCGYLPYERVLPMVSCMVTNGGYTGVTLALSYGVPLVQIGRTEEKREVGARIVWSGTGRRIRGRRPRPSAIARAVSDVLMNPSYRTAAERLRDEISRNGDAPGRAAALISRLATTHQPVHRR